MVLAISYHQSLHKRRVLVVSCNRRLQKRMGLVVDGRIGRLAQHRGGTRHNQDQLRAAVEQAPRQLEHVHVGS